MLVSLKKFRLQKTRWNSSNGPAARLLKWPVFVLHLVTYGHTCHIWSHLSPLVTCVTCIYVWVSKYLPILYLSLKPGKSLFPVIHFVWEATFPEKILSPGSHISQVVTHPRKSHFREVIFRGSLILRIFTFPEKSYFPGIHISQEVQFPRNSHFPAK